MLLTTQYLEEADRLADRIAVIDHGVVIAEGTSAELKEQVGGDRLEVRVTPRLGRRRRPARSSRRSPAPRRPSSTARSSVPIARSGAVTEAVRRLDEAGIAIDDIATQRPTLDDVFLELTGPDGGGGGGGARSEGARLRAVGHVGARRAERRSGSRGSPTC